MNWIRGPLVVVNYISHRYKLAIILAVDMLLSLHSKRFRLVSQQKITAGQDFQI